MNANMMRTPLIKSGAVLLVLALLAYLTSASPEGSVLNSVGLIIIGAFRFVQWLIAMAIGISVCIAVLIGIFLFGVSRVDRELAASLYSKTKVSVAALLAPLFAGINALKCQDSTCTQSQAALPADNSQLKNDLQTIIAGEVKKVSDSQAALNQQFTSLSAKIQSIEEKTAGFAASEQVAAIADEIAASGQMLGSVQGTVTALEGKLNDTTQKLQAINPEQVLGDIPARLQKLEQKEDAPGFDPQPLNESIENLQKQVEELKKKNVPAGGGGKAKKKS